MKLRERMAGTGLKRTIEGNFGLPVELIDPEGNDITTNTDGEQLQGQVLYDRDGIDPETGNMVVVGETAVTLRRSALSRIPVAGENWGVRIPLNPASPTVLTTFVMNPDQAPIDGQSIGYIKIFLKEAEQV